MSVSLAVLVFFGVTVALVVLPLLPAFIEWRSRRDIEPLRVVQASEVNVRHFALGFRAYIENHLEPALEECRLVGGTREGSLKDGTPYLITADEAGSLLRDSEVPARRSERLILGCRDLRMPPGTLFLKEVYAAGSLWGEPGSVYRAILADGSVRLGARSRSLRWMHAGHDLEAGEDCVLHGRVSAAETIVLEEGCGFERLHARRICFGRRSGAKQAPGGAAPADRELLRPEDLHNLVEVEGARWLIEDELQIPEGVLVEADLVVTGWGRIGAGARIVGSVKAHSELYLDERVEIAGSAVSGGNLFVAQSCRILGPALAEGEIRLDRLSVIGEDGRPTTVSARDIYVAPGVSVHGTVWAHVDGWVSSSVSGSWSSRAA